MSGIGSNVDNMCVEGCTAFMAEYPLLDHRPTCNSHRYDQINFDASNSKVKSPIKAFHTIPLGPQLQTLYQDPCRATHMQYRDEHTRNILKKL
ncbi:hypothetical protein EDD22DRAFT_729522, partial [Suillus occidentalis]